VTESEMLSLPANGRPKSGGAPVSGASAAISNDTQREA
jgi:hypothetical protein